MLDIQVQHIFLYFYLDDREEGIERVAEGGGTGAGRNGTVLCV